MTEPTSPQFADVLRRLRARSVSSFDFGDRTQRVRRTLTALEILTAAAQGRDPYPVPELEAYVYADQLTVLLAEAALAGVDPATVEGLMQELAAGLSLR